MNMRFLLLVPLLLLLTATVRAETFTGTVSSSDYVIQTHAFTLAEDGAWSFDVTTTGDLSIWNRGIKVYAADGSTLIQHYLYLSSGDSRGPLGLKAGSYVLAVEGVQPGSYTVTSQFTAQPLSNDSEPNDQQASAQGTTLSEGLNGHLGYHDSGDGERDTVDWWRLTLPEDGALTLTVDMDDTVTFWNQFLEIYDADGSTLLETYRYISNNDVPVTRGPLALRAGDYYLKVMTSDSAGYYGGYTVATQSTASAFANDNESNDEAASAAGFSLGGAITGHLGYEGGGAGNDNDPVDWWRFSVADESEVTFTIDRDADLSLWNYGATIYESDATTRVVQYNYFNETSKTFSPRTFLPGTYYVKVQGSGYGGYRISSVTTGTAPSCGGSLTVTDPAGNSEVRSHPLTVGDTLQLTAGGIDCTGGTPEYSWTTTGFLGSESGPMGEVLSVTQQGLVTAVAEGYAFVRTEETTTGQWVENTYRVSAAAAECGAGNLEACTTVDACTGAGGYWNFDWCGADPQSDSSHFPTYCEQGYTDYCESDDGTGSEQPQAGTVIDDWIPRTDADYQSVAGLLQQSDGYRLDGGVWSNGRPNAAGEYDGNGVQSRAEYNFVGRTTHAAFMVHGAGQYAAWWVKPWYLPMHHMNSHHSWADGLLIPDDTWIYASYDIGGDGNWSMVLASGDYESLGGTVLHRESGTLTAEQLEQLASSPFLVTFTDNYGGVDAYMVIGEVRFGEASAVDAAGDCRSSYSLGGVLDIPCVQVGDTVYDTQLALAHMPGEIAFELLPGTPLETVTGAEGDSCLARYDTFHGLVLLPCVDVAQVGGGSFAVWAQLTPAGGTPGGGLLFRLSDYGQ